MEDNKWYEGIEKEISSLKGKMLKEDFSAFQLDTSLCIAQQVSSLSAECSQCAESKKRITNAISSIAGYPNISKEQKDDYNRIFRSILKHLEKNHGFRRGGSMAKLILRNGGLSFMAIAAALGLWSYLWTISDPTSWGPLGPAVFGVGFFLIGLIQIIIYYLWTKLPRLSGVSQKDSTKER